MICRAARSASIDSSGRLAPSANQVNSFPACPVKRACRGSRCDKPGYEGGNRHRAAAEFGTRPFGESEAANLAVL